MIFSILTTFIYNLYRIYFYIEHEIDIKNPSVSDYHIYRFR